MITNYLARYQPDGKCTPTRPKYKTVISIVDWPIDTPNFPSFSRLPVELRRQIYQNALPAPRILELEGTPYYENMTKIWDITIRELEYTSTFARDAMNFMLSSRLAREVFLENYHELELQEETEHSSDTERVPVSNMMPGNVMSMGSMTPASGPPRLNGEPFLKWNANLQRAYVDGKRDTLLFNNHDIKMLDECGAWIDLRRIKKFALGFQHNNFPPAAQSALSFASRCPSLESLNLIIRNPCPDPAFDLTAYLGYGFLELNDQLAYKISDRWQYCGQDPIRSRHIPYSASSMRDWIEGAILRKTNIRKNIKVRVSFLTKIYLVQGESTRNVFLLPKTPLYHGVSYLTRKPTQAQYAFRIDWLDLFANCEEDGTPKNRIETLRLLDSQIAPCMSEDGPPWKLEENME